MTDSPLRELERRFRATGSDEDEAAWLRARLQAGSLTPSNLELASYCGHQAALIAFGHSVSPLTIEGIEVEWPTTGHGSELHVERRHWLDRFLELGGGEAVLRAAVALYRRSPSTRPDNDVTLWNTNQRVNPMRDTTIAIEEWILSSRDQAALARFKDGIGLDAAVARNMARCVCPVGGSEPTPAAQAVQELRGVLRFLRLDVTSATAAIRSELVPWALGYSDPVRERVEALQREAAGG